MDASHAIQIGCAADPSRAARDAIEGRDSDRSDLVARMADAIGERAGIDGCCTVDDLRTAGFTVAEIAEHADDARRIFRDRIVAGVRHVSRDRATGTEPKVEPPALAPERHILLSATTDQLAALDELIGHYERLAAAEPLLVVARERAHRARDAYRAIIGTGLTPVTGIGIGS